MFVLGVYFLFPELVVVTFAVAVDSQHGILHFYFDGGLYFASNGQIVDEPAFKKQFDGRCFQP